ncbi:MAG: hypothetical protein ACLQVW_19680, partial [Limisphaerales bacterium]
MISGHPPDNTIDASLWEEENRLGSLKTLEALDESANRTLTELPQEVYENMCKYCAHLELISVFSKPAAVAVFLIEINMELEKGEYQLLRRFNIPEETLDDWRKERALQRRLIVQSENLLQSLYRFQFDRSFEGKYCMFRNSEWTISKSPLELPMSDMGLVTISEDNNRLWSILPIGPQLLLERIFYFDPTKRSSKAVVRSHNLTVDEAEYRLDTICSSAVIEIICS